MSPRLLKVAARARHDSKAKFNSLAHLIDVAALRRSFNRIRRDAAVGVDGISKDDYGRNLTANLEALHSRLKEGRYRHQAITRVHVPKDNGRTRPIGVSALEDKIVQGALREILEAVYEQDFLDCSHGFRPKRSAHDAIRELTTAAFRGEAAWILEADIQSFFDSLDRTWLKKMLQERVIDGSLLRLIGKCLHVGVMEGGAFSFPDQGTAQGSILSPLLGNVYLHYVLDLWFERVVRPRLRGKARLIRYCDDFVITFDQQCDAERVYNVLGQRFGKFGLTLHPGKTRLLPFQRPPRSQQEGKGPSTFDFLGFTVYWKRGRRGTWHVACKTRRARLGRALRAVYDWCRDHRHQPIRDQHLALSRRLQGHFNYFGVNGNHRSLKRLAYGATVIWWRWLCRRSQKSRLTWERFADLLRDFPLPAPHIMVQIW
jgi:group II intron reverse transcriptase/maturase